MGASGDRRGGDDALAPTGRLLIALRWAAGLGILLATAIARWVLDIDIPAGALLAVGGVVLSYNAALVLVARRAYRRAATIRRLLGAQIALDWLAMIAVVHLTGGIASRR